MYNLSHHITLRNCQRTFDVDTAVDSETLSTLENTANEFIIGNNLNLDYFLITNHYEIKLIHSAAIYDKEPIYLAWKTNTQVLAPLIFFCKPTHDSQVLNTGQTGRLYAKLGLAAIRRGYQTGFCITINSKVLDAWEMTKKYVTIDPNTGHYLNPIFLSIGKPKDPSKPYNWSGMYDKFHISHARYSTANISIKNNLE